MYDFTLWDETVVDRYGDVIKVDGINFQNFIQNPVVFFQHRYAGDLWDDESQLKSMVIGKCVKIWKEATKLMATIAFDETDEDVAKLVKKVAGGFLNACSIGFRRATYDANYPKLPGQSNDTITACELMEVSLVEIPAHPKALLVRKSYNIDGDSQKLSTKTSTQMDEKIKSLEELINQLSSELTETRKELKELKEAEANKAAADPKKEEKKEEPLTIKALVEALKSKDANATAPATDGRESWTYLDWAKNDPAGLKTMKQENPERFKSLKI